MARQVASSPPPPPPDRPKRSTATIFLPSLSWGSSRGIGGAVQGSGPPEVRVWASLGSRVPTPSAPSGPHPSGSHSPPFWPPLFWVWATRTAPFPTVWPTQKNSLLATRVCLNRTDLIGTIWEDPVVLPVRNLSAHLGQDCCGKGNSRKFSWNTVLKKFHIRMFLCLPKIIAPLVCAERNYW